MRIPVGVVVERRRAQSPWLDFIWRPISVLTGVPAADPWTAIADSGEQVTYYAGQAVIELHRTETASYIENLASGTPFLWVALRRVENDTKLELLAVTADPAEGEGLTSAGDDVVDTVPMPEGIASMVGAFIAEHHVERPFVKRKRERSAFESAKRQTDGPGEEG